MTIPTVLFYYFIIFANFITGNLSAVSNHNKLLVISYDAFRWDYFNRNITPFMNKLRSENTYAEYMNNIFVTKTFPNHFTMATGLFAETHGIIGNKIFDQKTNTVIGNSYELYHYNENIAPFWIYNEKQSADRYSGVMMWPGCEYPYLGITPTFFQAFNNSWSWEARADELLSWFTDPKTPINLGVLYIEEPDSHGHIYGTNADVFNEIIQKLDNFTKYIHDELEKRGLADVNVVHLSDHGMQSVTKERIIDLNQFVNQSDYFIVETSAALQIFPKPGKIDTVYQQLVEGAKKNGHFTVYKKDEIPERYHYGKNPRMAPIFIVADIWYAFNDVSAAVKAYEKKNNLTVSNQMEFGIHGYDNGEPDMRPMFFAYGPMFKKHYKLEPFNNTDLFPMFCKILESTCPAGNGTLDNVESCLEINADISSYKVSLMIVGLLVLLVFVIAVATFVIKRRRERAGAHYSYQIHDENHFIHRIIPTDSGREDMRNSNQDYCVA